MGHPFGKNVLGKPCIPAWPAPSPDLANGNVDHLLQGFPCRHVRTRVKEIIKTLNRDTAEIVVFAADTLPPCYPGTTTIALKIKNCPCAYASSKAAPYRACGVPGPVAAVHIAMKSEFERLDI